MRNSDKIITVDGKVTLRGPVNTELEKDGIVATARSDWRRGFSNMLERKTFLDEYSFGSKRHP
jgi:hypothetical protein